MKACRRATRAQVGVRCGSAAWISSVLLVLLLVFEAETSVHFELNIDQHDCSVTVNNNADSDLKKEKDDLVKDLGRLQSSFKNLTEEKEQLQSRYNQIQSSLVQLQRTNNNLQSGLNQLQSRCNDITDMQRRLCVTEGFTLDGSVCYYYSKSTERKSWAESRQYCRDKQSDLIIIDSRGKQELMDRVVTRGWAVWIGLSDREEEESFKWVDGTPLTSPTFWGAGQPNDSEGTKDCVYFYYGGSGEWGVVVCSTAYRFICERVVS